MTLSAAMTGSEDRGRRSFLGLDGYTVHATGRGFPQKMLVGASLRHETFAVEVGGGGGGGLHECRLLDALVSGDSVVPPQLCGSTDAGPRH